jgi:hypothetical protein
MKIKQIVAGGLAAAATLGVTLFGALGAVTLDQGLQPFVKVTDTTLSSPAIVIGGAGVSAVDVLGAADIAASMVSNYAVVETVIPAAGATSSVVNGVLIKSEKDYAWLNTSATFSNIKTSITETDLGLLEKGSVDTTSGTPVKYEQLINMGGHYVEYNENPEDIEEPVLNVKFDTATTYDLVVNFFGGLDTDYVDTTTEITLFGKTYTFGPNPANDSLILYSQTGAETVTIGNTAGLETSSTVEADGIDYTITFLGWDPANTDTATVKIEYGGSSVTKSWTESNTYTLPGSTTQVFVNRIDVVATGAESQSGSMELFIGTDKLELEDTKNVKKNTDTMDYTTVAFSSTGTKINTLTFSVAPDDDTHLIDGGEFVDPLFGSFKFVLDGMTPGVTSGVRDVVKIAKSGTEKVKLTFTNEDGTEYGMDVFYYDSGWKLGESSTRAIYVDEANTTAVTNMIPKNSYFVLVSGEKSYILKYTGYDSDDKVLEFSDVGSSEDYEMTYTGTGLASGTLIIGAAQFDVKYNETSHAIAVDLNDDGTIEDGDYSVLKTKGDGIIDLSGSPGNVTFTEDALYTIGDYEPTEKSLNFAVNYGTDEIESVSVQSGLLGGQVGSEKLEHYLSYYGTYIVRDTDSDSVTIYYPGNRPAYVNVAVGSDPVISTTAGAAGGTYNSAVPISNPVAKLASEIPQTSALNQDLIVVGGPCANGIVEKLLAAAWNKTSACDYWLGGTDTDLAAGKGVIRVVEDVFGSGQKALIVAGTNAEDTRNLIANYVIKKTKMATLTGAEYKGSVA